MANPELIPYKYHVEWVRKNLIEEQKLLLFLVRLKGKAIGLSLLRGAGDTTEIGVMFREPNRHRVVTYTTAVATLHFAFCHLRLNNIISYVIPSHHIAISFNCSFGAWEVKSDKPDLIKFQLSREVCLNNENYLKVFDRIKDQIDMSGELQLSTNDD
jgi:hypothetical protein